MAQYLDNPAGRLHAMLSELKQVQDRGTSTARAWGAVLGVAPADRADLLRAFADVQALPSLIEAQVKALPDLDGELFLRWQPKVNAALGFSFDSLATQVANVLEAYDEATLNDLEHCSYQLHRAAPDVTLGANQVSSLTDDVDDLIVAIEDSDLPESLSRLLVSRLEEVRWRLSQYAVTGGAGAVTALDLAVGTLMREPQLTVQIQQRPDVWTKVNTVIAGLALALGVVTAIPQLEQSGGTHTTNVNQVEGAAPSGPASVVPNGPPAAPSP